MSADVVGRFLHVAQNEIRVMNFNETNTRRGILLLAGHSGCVTRLNNNLPMEGEKMSKANKTISCCREKSTQSSGNKEEHAEVNDIKW